MAIDRWMDKEAMVHVYNGILLNLKKNEILPFAEPKAFYTEWSKSEREI